MNIVLLHNESAGEGELDGDQLVAEINNAGHKVLHVLREADDLASLLRDPALASCDLVVAAGGDGTVDKAGYALLGSGVAMTVLPLGTANNVARALGIVPHTPVEELIAAWARFQVRPMDVAAVRHVAGGETRTFLEAFGVGVFPEVIRRAKKLELPPSRRATLARDRSLLLTTLAEARPRPVELHVWDAADDDGPGKDVSGDFLMVEVLNIPFIGPGIAFAGAGNVADGKLDLVTVSADHRTALLGFIAAVMRGEEAAPPPLPTRKAGRVRLRHGDADHHHDGKRLKVEAEVDVEVEVDDGFVEVEITARPGALSVLAP